MRQVSINKKNTSLGFVKLTDQQLRQAGVIFREPLICTQIDQQSPPITRGRVRKSDRPRRRAAALRRTHSSKNTLLLRCNIIFSKQPFIYQSGKTSPAPRQLYFPELRIDVAAQSRYIYEKTIFMSMKKSGYEPYLSEYGTSYALFVQTLFAGIRRYRLERGKLLI